MQQDDISTEISLSKIFRGCPPTFVYIQLESQLIELAFTELASFHVLRFNAMGITYKIEYYKQMRYLNIKECCGHKNSMGIDYSNKV